MAMVGGGGEGGLATISLEITWAIHLLFEAETENLFEEISSLLIVTPWPSWKQR